MAKKEKMETPEVEEVVEEEVVDETELNWKAAAKKLKALVEDQSIDAYFKKDKVEALRARYNDKERSEELFNLIMEV